MAALYTARTGNQRSWGHGMVQFEKRACSSMNSPTRAVPAPTSRDRTTRPKLAPRHALGIALVIGLVYASAFPRLFDYHDSFLFYLYADHNNCSLHPQWSFFFLEGRPIYSILMCLVDARITHTIRDAVLLRSIGVGIAILSACWFADLLIRLAVPPVVAALGAASLFALPAVQLDIGLSQAVMFLVAFPCIALAFSSLKRGCGAVIRRAFLTSWWCFLAATLWLLVASNIFQQFSSLLFCFVFAGMWPADWKLRRSIRLLLVSSVAVYAAHGVVYLLIYHNFTVEIWAAMTGRDASDAAVLLGERAVAISMDPVGKLYFLAGMTREAFSLWLPGAPTGFLVAGTALALGSVAAGLWLDYREGVLRHGGPSIRALGFPAEKLMYLVLLVLLISSPNLLARSDSYFLRHWLPFQWSVILLFLLTGVRVYRAWDSALARRFVPLSIAVFTIAFVGLASWNFYRNFVAINAAEFEFISQALAGFDPVTNAPPVCVVLPGVENLGAIAHPETQGDEFGRITTMYQQDVPGIVAAAMQNMTGRLFGNTVVLRSAAAGKASGCGRIVDMRRFAEAWKS